MLKKLFGLSQPSALIHEAFAEIGLMLQQAGRMLDHSLAVLLDNRPLDVDLEEMDDAIDESERTIRRSILEHLVVSPRSDLSTSLVLASIVQDAERIGAMRHRAIVIGSGIAVFPVQPKFHGPGAGNNVPHMRPFQKVAGKFLLIEEQRGIMYSDGSFTVQDVMRCIDVCRQRAFVVG